MPVVPRAAVRERVGRLELPFNRHGIDPYGVRQGDLARVFTWVEPVYRHYFRVAVTGLEHVPARGRAMLVGNHSGGYAVDGAMVIASLFFDKEPPRLVQSMVDKFINRLPFASQWSSRLGQFTGLPEHAERLLRDDRVLLVFPEGARGTAKLYPERNTLVDFGSGFMRLALATRAPIIPFGFVGGGEAIPTIANLHRLGELFGVPYIPITPYLLPVPRPVPLAIHYGEPMWFEGSGSEDDDVVAGYVERVRDRVSALLGDGRPPRAAVAHGETP
jgi:1-acyl-sn-glycerol-3-phosphate acyltransferase